MKVKICGLTNKDDAVWAINYGADYVGLNFYKESPRYISIANAAKWIAQIPSFAQTVGVFVNETKENIVKTVDKLGLKGIQLHGGEEPHFLRDLKSAFEIQKRSVLIIKAFRIQDQATLEQLPFFNDSADYFLLDSMVPGEVGGTGVRFNWDLAIEAKKVGKPIFLAGGLTPDNIREAVKKVAPFAVDVASGVEKSPKRKDLAKLQDFISKAKK